MDSCKLCAKQPHRCIRHAQNHCIDSNGRWNPDNCEQCEDLFRDGDMGAKGPQKILKDLAKAIAKRLRKKNTEGDTVFASEPLSEKYVRSWLVKYTRLKSTRDRSASSDASRESSQCSQQQVSAVNSAPSVPVADLLEQAMVEADVISELENVQVDRQKN